MLLIRCLFDQTITKRAGGVKVGVLRWILMTGPLLWLRGGQ